MNEMKLALMGAFGVVSAAVCVAALCLAFMPGCPAAVPAVNPVASCVASVIADALQGMSIPEILKAAGPGCVKDAEEVITILFGSVDKVPGIASTPAYVEAKARRGIK